MYTSNVHGGKYGEGYAASSVGGRNNSMRSGYQRQGSLDSISLRHNTYPPKMQDEYATAAEKGLTPSKTDVREFNAPGRDRKSYLRQAHKGVFMRRGKGKTCIRCACCTLIVVILLLVTIVSTFLLWVRPPKVTSNGMSVPQDAFQTTSSGFTMNVTLNVDIVNPNFFGANFKQIKATAFYPGANSSQSIGGGSLENVDIPKKSNTTIHFPFQIKYTSDSDPFVLKDLASKCGLTGSAKEQITIDYDLTVRLKLAAITVSPTFRESASFDCPDISLGDLFDGGGLGSALGGLSGLRRRWLGHR